MKRNVMLSVGVLGGRGGSASYTPSQSIGAELLTNPSMDWSAGTLTGWTVAAGTVGGDPGVSAVAASGGAGTDAVRFYSSATANQPRIEQTGIFTAGDYVEASATAGAWTSGAVDVRVGAVNAGIITTASTRFISRVPSGNTNFDLQGRGVAPRDLVIAAASAKKLTLNAQLTAPSADMDVSFLYTLPVTPLAYDSIWLMSRISDFSAGNYWLIHLQYLNAQWGITLYSVAAHTRTSQKTASNIGTTNGLRFYASGTTIRMYSSADSGQNWTQRGTDLTSSTYQTATGVNVIYASEVTPGVLSGAFL